MAGFNKVILIGNLTRNPELRYTPNSTPVAALGLAVSRRYKQGDDLKEEVCFVDIVVFGSRPNTVDSTLAKGTASSWMADCSSGVGKRKTVRSAASMKWSLRRSHFSRAGRRRRWPACGRRVGMQKIPTMSTKNPKDEGQHGT